MWTPGDLLVSQLMMWGAYYDTTPEKLSKPWETPPPPPPRLALPELATLLMLCLPLFLVLRHHHHHNASPYCSSLG